MEPIYKQIRRNGKNITIDTRTGQEVGPGEGMLKPVVDQLRTVVDGTLLNNTITQGRTLLSDINNVLSPISFFSDTAVDEYGRPLTRAQAGEARSRSERHKEIYKTAPQTPQVKKLLSNLGTEETNQTKKSKTTMWGDGGSALAAMIPVTSQQARGEQLQQERDSEGLTPMQQWAKKYKDTLAPKVKEGQSGFKEIDAYFKAQDMSIDEPGGRITPVEMLQKMSGGQEVVIGPDGISDPTPIKPEIASTPRQKDTPDINNPVPASKEKADQYLQSFLPGTPTLTTSFNQSQGNLPVSDYLSTDKPVGANYMRFGEDPEVTKAVMNLFPDLPNSQNPFSRDYNPNVFID